MKERYLLWLKDYNYRSMKCIILIYLKYKMWSLQFSYSFTKKRTKLSDINHSQKWCVFQTQHSGDPEIGYSKLNLVYIFFFRATPMAYGSSQGSNWNCICPSTPYHSNTGSKSHLRPTPQLTATPDSLTHWARPGVKPTSSWIPAGFVSAAPQQEFP